MRIIGGVWRGVTATWQFVSPVYWDGFHRIRPTVAPEPELSTPVDGELGSPVTVLAEDDAFVVASDSPQPIKPRWRAPMATLTHDAIPSITLAACWTVCKDRLHPESNEDAAVWVADRKLAAVFDGATESFAARRWVNIVSSAWASRSSLDLEALQREYTDEINAMELSWAQESAADRGSFTTLASIAPAPGGLAATCVGDSAILLVKDEQIVQAYPSMDPVDYSSVPDALGSTAETLGLGQEFLQTCSWTIPVEPGVFDAVVLATDAVAVWLLEGNEAQPNERLFAARAVSDDSEWEHLVAQEREAGRMKTDDSTLMVVTIEVPA